MAAGGLVGWFVRDGISSSSAQNDEEIPIIYQTAGAAVESQTSLVTSDRGETLSIARPPPSAAQGAANVDQ
jgi:hypothetical protein